MLKLLIVLAFASISFPPWIAPYHLNSKSDPITNLTERLHTSHGSHGKNITVSLEQFNVFNSLGKGKYGIVHLATKNGGFDDGILYALKAINLTYAFEMEKLFKKDILIAEREVLEAVLELAYSTGLHYAFRVGSWLIFIMDLGSGGSLYARLTAKPPDANTAQIILAEIVSAVEELHNLNILHGDLKAQNIVIDSEGHLMLTDFGFAEHHPINDWQTKSKRDWEYLSSICYPVFCKLKRDETMNDLIAMLRNMTDTRLPELKLHPYFNGTDWNKVAQKKSPAPYEAKEIQIQGNALDLVALLKIDIRNSYDGELKERFQNYSFVATEHRCYV